MTERYTGRITGLHRSDGGVPKLPVDRAEAGVEGMEGDRQANRKYHGGPERALCIYTRELVAALAAEGHAVVPGTLGENVTVEGLPWNLVRPGSRMMLGAVEVQVTSFATPCSKLRTAFADGGVSRVSEVVHPGWSRVYVRVLRGGGMAVGDPAELLQ